MIVVFVPGGGMLALYLWRKTYTGEDLEENSVLSVTPYDGIAKSERYGLIICGMIICGAEAYGMMDKKMWIENLWG
jgi:hypothetical protein